MLSHPRAAGFAGARISVKYLAREPYLITSSTVRRQPSAAPMKRAFCAARISGHARSCLTGASISRPGIPKPSTAISGSFPPGFAEPCARSCRCSAAGRRAALLPRHDPAAFSTDRHQILRLPYWCRFGVNDGGVGALTLTLIEKRLAGSFIWVGEMIKDSRARGGASRGRGINKIHCLCEFVKTS